MKLTMQNKPVALVTGANKGIGLQIAKDLAEHGFTVLVGSRNLERGHTAAKSVGADARAVQLDVTDRASITAAAQLIRDEFGRLDVLVNNAGGAPPSDTATASPRFTASIVTLNLIAPFVFAQRAYAVMHRQPEGGVIVNISSVSGLRPSPGTAAYGAAKAGLVNLTQTLGVEFAPKVRVVCVTVGLVRTEQAHLFYGDERSIAAVDATVPLGRMAEPADVGDVCVLLASPRARYVTGVQVVVHGGGEWPAYLGAVEESGGSP